ncbi:DNA alkylation repair protein [Carboxylicivirga marina]|uniref:DNA alkylation repair protein n=1 Tax=Carboxylicivirga marina TaxID=2800988 RepID=UPI0025973918|nr:DNA alkylation repair protein [uncultured Carboxylicivirga sp.]
MKFFIENQKVEKEVEWVLGQLRLHMNGATTAQMENSGINYRINYGVGLPHLQQLSKRIPVSYELAERLWFLEIRETMILASMIVPADKMTEEKCLQWATKISNKDLVERSAMYLWSRLENSSLLCVTWLAGESTYLKATSFYTIGRILQAKQSGSVPTARDLVASVNNSNELYVLKALSFALRMKLRVSASEREEIKKLTNEFKESGSTNKKIVAQELLTEIEFTEAK